MPKPENIIGKGFESRPQDINRKGRPPKIYTVLKKKGYNGTDIKTAFGELAFYTEKELKAVIKDEKKPIITQIIAKALLKALDGGKYYLIKEIMEHVIGKPIQSNVNLELSKDDLKDITPFTFYKDE